MADRISVVYDANVDEFKRKLDELIAKNNLLKGAVDGATKSLTAMGQVVEGQAKKVTINVKTTNDYRTILNEVNKVVNDSRQILKAATEATERNTKAQNDNAQATERAGRAKKAKTDAVVVHSKAVQDNSIKLTQNNTVHNNHSKTLDQSVKNVTNLNTKLVENNKTINDNSTNIKNVTDSYNRYINGVAQASHSTGQAATSVSHLSQSLQSIKAGTKNVFDLQNVIRNLAGLMAGAFAVNSLISFGRSIVDVTRQTEILQNRLAFVFETGVGGQMAFDRLYKTAQRLGLEFEPLIEGFSKFAIAAKTVGFSAAEAEDMFVKISAGLRAAGASSLQTQRAFLALEQMLSKGVVSAEELRRQLGEALPGAANLMVRAYNKLHPGQEVTNQEFIKLMESGKIMSAEVLPELSRTIEDVFTPALAGKAGSLDAAINRVNTSFSDLKRSLGQMNLTEISNAFTELSTRIENIKNVIAAPPKFKTGINFIDNLFGMKAANALALTGEIMIQGLMGDVTGNAEAARQVLEKEFQAFLKKVETLGKTTARQISLGATESIEALTSDQLLVAMEKIEKQLGPFKNKLFPTKEENEQMRVLQGTYSDLLTQFQSRSKFEAEQSDNSEQQAKDAIAAAKERVALEETLLLKTKENTVAYVNQMIKVIEARKNLVKLEKAGTPLQMGLDLAKLDQELERYKKMINSFTPEMAGIVEEGIYVPSVEAWEKLDKENRKFAENQLELALTIAQRGVEITEEGTEARLIAERNLALQVAEIEKFKVNISSDSEELKASKIKLINNKLRNELKKLGFEYVEDQKEIQDRIIDIIQEANDLIERTEGDSFQRRMARSKQMFEDMARKIKEEMSKTSDFDLLGALIKKLGEVEEAGEKAASAITLDQAANMVSQVGDLYGELSKRQSVLYENEQNNLKKMLDQKLISEEEYERRSMELKKKQFNQERQSAIISAIIDGASGIMKAIALFQYWQIPFITALTAAQISTISAQQFPGFKEGVIDLKGPGSETSDSIPARLSRGESVMTAEETKRYKPVLQAIRDGEFEAFVAKKYTGGIAMQRDTDSFAQNISNSFEMQTAELANLLRQNRKVAVKNVDELAKAINHRGTAHKVINRRTIR